MILPREPHFAGLLALPKANLKVVLVGSSGMTPITLKALCMLASPVPVSKGLDGPYSLTRGRTLVHQEVQKPCELPGVQEVWSAKLQSQKECGESEY